MPFCHLVLFEFTNFTEARRRYIDIIFRLAGYAETVESPVACDMCFPTNRLKLQQRVQLIKLGCRTTQDGPDAGDAPPKHALAGFYPGGHSQTMQPEDSPDSDSLNR
jgi:hypothetical protein